MFSSITGLVGSATITIKKTDANMLQITIFNVTSLTSGDLWKALWVQKDQSNWPKILCQRSGENNAVWQYQPDL